MKATRIAAGVAVLWLVAFGTWAEETSLQFQVGHWSEIEHVQFSSDGTRLTSVDSRGVIKVWEGDSLRIVRALPGFPTYLSAVTTLYDGELVVFGVRTGTVAIWDTTTDEEVLSFQAHGEQVSALAADALARYLLSGAKDGSVRLWDVASGELIRKLESHGREVSCAAFSPDGRWMASGGKDQMIKVYDVASGQKRRELGPLPDAVLSLCFHPDSQRVASGSQKGVVVWEVEGGRQLQSHDTRGKVGSIRYSDDGRLLVAAEHGWVGVWNAETGAKLHTLKGTSVEFYSVDIAPNGGYVASGGVDKVLRLWRLSDGSLAGEQKPHRTTAYALNFFPDGGGILFSADGKMRRLDLATGSVSPYLAETEDVGGLVFSPTGKYLAGRVGSEQMKVWEVATGKTARQMPQSPNFVNGIAFSPDEKYLASVSFNILSKDLSAKLWELATGKLARSFEGHTRGMNTASFSPDGRLMATSSADRTIRIWEVASGRCVRTLTGHESYVSSADFSPNGRYVASGGGDAAVKLWEASSGRMIRTFTGHGDSVQRVAFSPDGKHLASAGQDKTVRLWEVATGRCVWIGREHIAGVGSLAFSADGQALASAGWDGLLCVRAVPSGEVLVSAQLIDEDTAVIFTPEGEYMGAGGIERFLSLGREWRLLSPAEIESGFRRDAKVLAALSRVRPSKQATTTASREVSKEKQPAAVPPPAPPADAPQSFSARDIKPLLGTWVFPFGLKVPQLWAKEVWNEDGTGAIYDSLDDAAPMDRFTFEVKKKDPQQPIYHVVIRYTPTLAFYALIKVSPDGSYKESETYGPNVSTFPPFFNPRGQSYTVLYREPKEGPSNKGLVGTWIDPRGATAPGRLGKVVFNGDYTGAVYDLAADLKPLDSFKYEIVWQDPRFPVYLMIITYRPDNFWYLFVSMNPNGKTLEWDSTGRCRPVFPAGVGVASGLRFYGERQ